MTVAAGQSEAIAAGCARDLVERQPCVGIEPVLGDVVDQDAHCEPEPRAVVRAFRFQADDRLARALQRGVAVFLGEVGGDAAEVVGGQQHARQQSTNI